jgi:hypothetical protein
LPDVPDFVGLSDQDKQRALDDFYSQYPKYAGILDTWDFDESYKYYDETAGRYVSENQLRALSERYLKRRVSVVDQLVGLLLASMFLPKWVSQARNEIRQTYFTMYVLGRGGVNKMTPEDWGRLSEQLKTQYHYFNNFANEMADGGLSEDQISYRTSLYLNSSRQAFEVARTIGARNLILPAYPGDGSSECGVNCKCWWRIIEFDDKWDAYWIRTAGESCPTCQARASIWVPYVVYK